MLHTFFFIHVNYWKKKILQTETIWPNVSFKLHMYSLRVKSRPYCSCYIHCVLTVILLCLVCTANPNRALQIVYYYYCSVFLTLKKNETLSLLTYTITMSFLIRRTARAYIHLKSDWANIWIRFKFFPLHSHVQLYPWR